MDVGQNTTLSDGYMTKQLVQLFVISNGELQMTRNDTGLLVVAGGVASQLEDFSSEILKDGGEVNRSTWGMKVSVRQRLEWVQTNSPAPTRWA